MANSDFIDKLLEALTNKKVKEELIKVVNEKNDILEEFCDNNPEEKEDYIKAKNRVLELEDEIKKEKSNKQQLLTNICELEKTINELNNKLEFKDSIIINLEKENSNLKERYIDQQQKLECEKNEVEKINKIYQLIYGEAKEFKEKVSYYENTYKSLNLSYESFKNLKSQIHSELANVIKTEDCESFLCSGVQWDNIEALWSFISYKLNEYDENETNILIDTFHYFFERYNKIHRLYELLKVEINDEFDEDLHTRASNSCVTGKISKILLKGYKNIRTDKIVKKSIVRV